MKCKHLRLEEIESVRIKRFRCKDCGALLYANRYGKSKELIEYGCSYTKYIEVGQDQNGPVMKRRRVCKNPAKHFIGRRTVCEEHYLDGRMKTVYDNRRTKPSEDEKEFERSEMTRKQDTKKNLQDFDRAAKDARRAAENAEPFTITETEKEEPRYGGVMLF